MPAQRQITNDSSSTTAAKGQTYSSDYTTTTSNPGYPTAAAHAREAEPQSKALPRELQDIVPFCAQQCLHTYISYQYGSCNGLSCLCSEYSSEGYTLGELGFICLQSACSSIPQAKQEDVYGVCSAAAHAAMATHSTLTLPATTASSYSFASKSSTLLSTTSSNVPSQTTSKSYISDRPATSTAVPATSMATRTSSSTSSTATSESTSASAAASSSSSHSTSLTSAEAVGVSIAAFGALALIIALIYGITCFRRDRWKAHKRKHDSYDFIDEEPSRFSSFGQNDNTQPNVSHNGFTNPRAELPVEKRDTKDWYQAQFPAPAQAVLRDRSSWLAALGRSQSPVSQSRSNESMRTLSQLLPDKPGSMPPVRQQQQQQPPPRPQRSPKTLSMAQSPATVFEEDRETRIASQQLPAMPRPPVPVGAQTGLPGKNVRRPQFAAEFTLSPDEVRGPQLSLNIPKQPEKAVQKLQSPIHYPPPPAIPEDQSQTVRGYRSSRGSKAKSGASTTAGSLLNYYASAEAGTVPDFWDPEPTPIPVEPQHCITKAKPNPINPPKPTCPPRAIRTSTGASRRDSRASETSFESTDPDEPTPPDEDDKQLSPVAETEHSPIAKVRYPKIPRSSNQAIPRSPPVKLMTSPDLPKNDRSTLPSHQRQQRRTPDAPASSPVTPQRQMTDASTLSGSTLAAKRRGDSAAHDLEKRLVIDTSHSRGGSHARSPPRKEVEPRTSPLHGYGRSARTPPNSHPLRAQSTAMLSPESVGSLRKQVVRTPKVQEVVLKSPLWEPKLTPSRRGEDLYLEVGLASPTPMSGVDASKRNF
ncbi:hypothetical protein D0865_02365 [Hortaea werneckii]|uniref:Extracellular membrane protein CFEM domain-containing protein n=1 Tax=Hortaea werneckii TaxID=91943 RepID=A0A3M7D3X0_HORWE|nr:hypothetical protein D0865_02365 [Hortaea werneckii]